MNRISGFKRDDECVERELMDANLELCLWTEPREVPKSCLSVDDKGRIRVYVAAVNYDPFRTMIKYNVSTSTGAVVLAGHTSGALLIPALKSIDTPGVGYDFATALSQENDQKDDCICDVSNKRADGKSRSLQMLLQLHTAK